MSNRETVWFSLLLLALGLVNRSSASLPCAARDTDTGLCAELRQARCSECPANSRVRHACNATHDALCECNKDHYQQLDKVNDLEVTLTCRPCDLCPHGWGATRPCSPAHNTVCRKCPQGTYSSVVSPSRPCAVCAICREDQTVLHECTPIQDTVCADKEGTGRPGRRLISQLEDSIVHQKTTSEDYNNNPGVIFVYCLILGAVVLGLLFYVFLKQWKLHGTTGKLTGSDNRSSGSTMIPLTKSFLYEGFHPIIDTAGSNPATTPVTLETRLRDLSMSKRCEMERLLNPRRDHADWRALARQLGFAWSKIASFEQKSLKYGGETNPTRHLFAEWSKRGDSTVGRLLQALFSIGRYDVTLVLLPIQENTDTLLLNPCSKTVCLV